MQFSEYTSPTAIESYQNGSITIAGQTYTQPIIIGQSISVFADMPAVAHMQPEHFQAAVQAGAEIIIIGSGEKQQFAAPQTVAALSALGIGLESMSTAAACRTFSLLQSEGRKVWAWLHV